MTAKTSAQRVKQQRQARLDEGWEEVRVWVPSAEAATEIRRHAEMLRRQAERLPGLDQACRSMNHETYQRIKDAILQQGSPAYNTVSGAVLDLLSVLAAEGDLRAISEAFIAFSKAKPGNMAFVGKSIPAKIVNHFWLRALGLDDKDVISWTDKNPGWADTITSHLRDTKKFEQVVMAAAEEIREVGQAQLK